MLTESKAAFLGSGWAFPPAFTEGGADVLFVHNEQDIIESIKILLSTSLGERVMQEDYGCNLQDYLFEELDNRLLVNLRIAITNAIRLHETRIDLDEVGFDIQADYTESVIYIRLTFRVRSTNSRYNMVYPFYLNESNEAKGLFPPQAVQTTKAIQPVSDTDTPVVEPALDIDKEVAKMSHVFFESFLHHLWIESTNKYTILDHPKLNGKPDALIFVNSLWGIENESAATTELYEVFYKDNHWCIGSKSVNGKISSANFFNVMIAPDEIKGSFAFVHDTPQYSIQGNGTLISSPFSDNNPEAYILVTPQKSTDNNHEIEVRYNTANRKWGIYNVGTENLIPVGTKFHVLILPKKSLGNLEAYAHKVSIDNERKPGTYLDNPLINGNQQSKVFFNRAWRSDKDLAHSSEHFYLWFDSNTDGYDTRQNNHWLIYPSSSDSPVRLNSVFNIFIVKEFQAFQHIATAQNTDNLTQPYTLINHPRINGDPDAMLFITSIWQRTNGVANPHSVEVGYVADKKQWAIFNRSQALMDKNYAFNVLIAPKQITGIPNVFPSVFVQKATRENILVYSTRTYIDNPMTNNKPAIHLLVTPRKSVPSTPEIGTVYDTNQNKWIIYHSVPVSKHDESPMLVDAEFNVLVIPEKQFANLEVLEPDKEMNIFSTAQQRVGAYINELALIGQPNAMIFVTQEWLVAPISRGGINEYPTQLRYAPPKDVLDVPDNHWCLIHPIANSVIEPFVYYNVVWVK